MLGGGLLNGAFKPLPSLFPSDTGTFRVTICACDSQTSDRWRRWPVPLRFQAVELTALPNAIQSLGGSFRDETRRMLFTTALPIGVAALAATATMANAQTVQSLTAVINTFVPKFGGFVGTFTLTGTQVINGVMSTVGTLTGNVLGPGGVLLGTVSQTVSAPLQVSASCQILSLTIGAIHLDLLGLVIDLNPIVLNITAVPGVGNLLGNLLCAVANLLNQGGVIATLLTQLSSLLNQIIAAL
jgi:hypothetical protein